MMKEEIKVVKETEKVRCCDCCETEICRGTGAYSQWPSAICCMCRKDLCEWHRCVDPADENIYSDDPPDKVYCPECFTAVELLLIEKKELEEKHFYEMQNIRIKIQNACKKKKEKVDD
jgi:hypothetical protein